MDEAIRYYADQIRAQSLDDQAQTALDSGDLHTYRSLSTEASQLRNSAEQLRLETVRTARRLALRHPGATRTPEEVW